MRRHNSYSLILTGLNVRYLRSPSGESIKDIANGISTLIRLLEELDFPVTLVGIRQLHEFLNNDLLKSENGPISAEQSIKLIDFMREVESVLFAEATTKQVFTTEERRYNLQYLLADPAGLFGRNVFTNLPDISKLDFTEGCKCIVFALPTASAFHVLRGTEGVLKQYYFHKIKRGREKKPMWGNMVKGLGQKKRGKPPPSPIR